MCTTDYREAIRKVRGSGALSDVRCQFLDGHNVFGCHLPGTFSYGKTMGNIVNHNEKDAHLMFLPLAKLSDQ